MAYVVVNGLFQPQPTNRASLDSNLLDADTEAYAFIFQAPKTGTIDRIGYLLGTVTTGATLDVRLETVGTDGNPSGTLAGTNTNGASVVADADDNVFKEVTLTAGASVTRGDSLAINIVAPAGANLNIMRLAPSVLTYSFPHMAHKASGSWTKAASSGGINSVRYSDTTYPYIEGMWPLLTATSDSFQTATNPDERGVVFSPTFDCKVSGAWIGLGSLFDFTVKLYDNTDTLLASKVVDGDHAATSTSRFVSFDAEVELTVGSNYRLTVLATSGSSVALRRFTWTSTYATQMAGQAWGYQLTTRNDSAGSWTDTANTRPQLGVILSQIDDGTGDGGGGGDATPFAYGFAS